MTTGTGAIIYCSPDRHEWVWSGRSMVLSLYGQSKHRARSAYYNLTSHRCSIQIQSMIRTQYRPRTATNYCGDVFLCAWHPCVEDTRPRSFRLIVSQHCYFMIVGMMSKYRARSGYCYSTMTILATDTQFMI